jgi:hypothetical protein
LRRQRDGGELLGVEVGQQGVSVFIAVNCIELMMPNTPSIARINACGVALSTRPKAAITSPSSSVLPTSTVR